MRVLPICAIVSILPAAIYAQTGAQTGELKTAGQVLDRYKKALGGEDAIRGVRWETVHGEAETSGQDGRTTIVSYSRPFQSVTKAKRADGTEITSGFDGQVSWSIGPNGANIDKDTPVESDRRDADLQYALHQPDYFKNIELAGIAEFEGRRCYWLHGTTHWGKDNNQYYDVATGLLTGYRFQSDSKKSSEVTTLVFDDYKNFFGLLRATKMTLRSGGQMQIFRIQSVSYDPLDDSLFELPEAVKALLKPAQPIE